MQNFRARSKKVLVAIIGGLVTLIGLILIPYPGPGWLIVFAGLAILATEFAFAARVLEFVRGKYDAWVEWLKRQHVAVRALTLAGTGVVVMATLWLLNIFGMTAQFIGLDYDWIVSPLFR